MSTVCGEPHPRYGNVIRCRRAPHALNVHRSGVVMWATDDPYPALAGRTHGKSHIPAPTPALYDLGGQFMPPTATRHAESFDHSRCATPDRGGCRIGTDDRCPIAGTEHAAQPEPLRSTLREVDSRNRISLTGVSKLHDRYLVEVAEDGVVILTPVDVVKVKL